MMKWFFIPSIIGILAIGIFYRSHAYVLPQEVATTRQESVQTVLPVEKLSVPDIPVSLSIPSLNVVADIEPVGMDEKGNMDVPTQNTAVAWYQLGYKPGETGSSVLAGHFDTTTGEPSVFYNLSTIKAGDTISVTDTEGAVHTYTMESQEVYVFDGLPLQDIFASSEPLLRLITCEGEFDSVTKNYSHRLVVTARLQPPAKVL